jgi:ubiquinone/menaquinone biosynthesis C-methylase UbiE
MKCRFCQHKLTNEFVDLVNSPPSNSFLTEEQLNQPETFYPLKLYVCDKCWLVQIDEHKRAEEIFGGDYVYFSSYSKTWLEHAKSYVDMIVKRLALGDSSLAVEIASNDGYLLQYFQQKHIPCLGIEPAEATAKIAREKGIEIIVGFFTEAMARQLVKQGKTADLLIGNNVLAHVPDINDFVAGLEKAIKPHGIITMEFPHLMRLVEKNQFDTIYHEHFSYFSFHAVITIFATHGLEIFDVEELTTHGGSLRIYAKHQKDDSHITSSAVERLKQEESRRGMLDIEFYKNFQQKIDTVKCDFLSFLIEQKRKGKKVAAYGAAAKGNTLLNYCGIRKDLISFVVDASPHKQGKFLPGMHIPVTSEEQICKHKPDFVIILAWNLKQEISQQLKYIREWGGRFVVSIPEIHIW